MSTLTDRLESLWGTVTQPANLTSLLEAFTLWGLVVPVIIFVVTWIFKEPKAQKACLLLIALAALAPFFVPSPSDTPLPGDTPWPYIALASLVGLTFFLGKGGKAGLWLTLLTLFGSLAVAALTISLTLDPPVELLPASGESPEGDPSSDFTYPPASDFPPAE